jgi:hypothetical protein
MCLSSCVIICAHIIYKQLCEGECVHTILLASKEASRQHTQLADTLKTYAVYVLPWP